MNSCLYVGTVRHRRFLPVEHVFEYRMFMVYMDLDELPGVFDGRWLWSARRPAPAWFRRSDYLGDPSVPLDRAVRDKAESETGVRPTGPIRMLTHLRYFGYVMNPVTFYYCFSEDGQSVETVLTEITNTPWNERHTYVLSRDPAEDREGASRHRFEKAFHVSPFMDMAHAYDWRFTRPDQSLVVHMENHRGGTKYFDATLSMRREEMTKAALRRSLLRHPWMTVRVATSIYWQAARLWLKRVPFHDHPKTKAA